MDHRDSSRVEVSGQRFDATHVNGTFKRAACGFRDRENSARRNSTIAQAPNGPQLLRLHADCPYKVEEPLTEFLIEVATPRLSIPPTGSPGLYRLSSINSGPIRPVHRPAPSAP